jgi:hypothetical protein
VEDALGERQKCAFAVVETTAKRATEGKIHRLDVPARLRLIDEYNREVNGPSNAGQAVQDGRTIWIRR